MLDRGFGGSRQIDVERLAEVFVLPYHLHAMVRYAGGNDFAEGLLPAQVAAGFVAMVRPLRVRQPDLPIVFVGIGIGIGPSPVCASPLPSMREANRRIRVNAQATPELSFVDVFTPMRDAHGAVRGEPSGSDRLHTNAAGRAPWRARLAPFLA